jgi:hypothetical protein
LRPSEELIGLGLFEQLPSLDLMTELTNRYFQSIHPGAPFLHQASYTASLHLPPHMRPPMCLQYIVLASAAATSDPHRHLSEPFYQRARVYAEADELRGQGETVTTLSHVQAWALISAYECHVYALFTRASTSLCRAIRIAQMLQLHRIDNHDDPQTLPLTSTSTPFETESRRRTWWVVFLADRFLTSTTGWPSLIDERHIRTLLPCSEADFAAGTPPPSGTLLTLSAAFPALHSGSGGYGYTLLPPLAMRILAANELLHALDHVSHHPPAHPPPVNLVRNLTALAASLPSRPRSLDAILVHIAANMALIRLHLHLHRSPPDSSSSSCSSSSSFHQNNSPIPLVVAVAAAKEITAIFRDAGPAIGAAIRNPLLAFAAYMAASVFLDPGASPPEEEAGSARWQRDHTHDESLQFLADVLVDYGRKSPLVRANAYQLAVDMLRTGHGYGEGMWARVQELYGWESGSELRVRRGDGNDGGNVLFCPAVVPPLAFVETGGTADGGLVRLGGGEEERLGGGGGWVAPSVLQADDPNGLFSMLEDGGFLV